MSDTLPGVSDEVLGHMERLAVLIRGREVLSTKVSLEVVMSAPSPMGFYGMSASGGTPIKRRLTIEYEV